MLFAILCPFLKGTLSTKLPSSLLIHVLLMPGLPKLSSCESPLIVFGVLSVADGGVHTQRQGLFCRGNFDVSARWQRCPIPSQKCQLFPWRHAAKGGNQHKFSRDPDKALTLLPHHPQQMPT